MRITKEKVIFTKGYEQTFSTEIFSDVKVTRRMLQPVYELSDLHVKVTYSPQTEFQIDKIVRTRNNYGIKEHLVMRRGYDATFNSRINATDIKKL